jgi:hypothetical protein
MAITEELLMAYADGELDAARRAEVEAAMAADPAVAERVGRHRRLRAQLAGAHREALSEPVPEALTGGVRRPAPTAGAVVVDLAEIRARRTAARERPAQGWRRWGTMAACLVGGLVVGAALMQRPAPMVVASAAGELTAQGPLAHALDTQLAAEPGGGARPVKIGVSFRSIEGRYCRTFQAASLAGVACREPRGWSVPVAVAANAAQPAGGYRTASSSLPAPVTAAVDAMIQGAPLDAHDEAAAKAAGWRGAAGG